MPRTKPVAAPQAPYTLHDVCEMSGFTARQIHEFRALGALKPPLGHGRGARYADEHVDALRAIRPLFEAGVSATRIAAKVKEGQGHPIPGGLASEEFFTERVTRVRIARRVEIAVSVGGSEDLDNRALLDHLIKETRQFLASSKPR